LDFENRINPNLAKAGGLQSQGIEGEAVGVCREPLTTLDLMYSGLSGSVNNMAKSTPYFKQQQRARFP